MGLIILSVVSAIITSGSASIGQIALITFRALLFLTGAVFLGQILALHLGKLFSKIHAGNGMKFCLAMIFCLSFAYFASLIDLAPIVGAFAAGLVLDPVDFKFFMDPQIVIDIREAIKDSDTTTKEHVHKALQLHTDHHIEDLIEPIGLFLVPIFFVITGINVKLETLFDLRILGIAVAITLIAAVGKIIAGTVAGKCNKLIVGFGMIPRGEVGLIFAVMGKSLGVINDEIFSIIVIVVMLTTLLTPPVLTAIIRIGDKNA